MNFDYGKALSRPWQIIWKHKVLWIFGILAGCARSSGNSNSGGGSDSGNQDFPFWSNNNPFESGQSPALEQFNQYFQDGTLILITVICLIILLSLLFFSLGMMGRIGLIKGTFKAESGAVGMAFGELWSESLPYFWRFFLLNFMVGLVIAIPLILIVALSMVTSGFSLLCLIPLVCMLIPVFLVVGAIIEQAQVAIVDEELGVVEGFRRGWELVRDNAGPVVVMSLILGVGGAIIGFIASLPMFIALIPLIGVGLTGAVEMVWISVACIFIYMPVLIFVNGLIAAYIQSSWTISYMQFTAKPQTPQTDEIVYTPNAS